MFLFISIEAVKTPLIANFNTSNVFIYRLYIFLFRIVKLFQYI